MPIPFARENRLHLLPKPKLNKASSHQQGPPTFCALARDSVIPTRRSTRDRDPLSRVCFTGPGFAFRTRSRFVVQEFADDRENSPSPPPSFFRSTFHLGEFSKPNTEYDRSLPRFAACEDCSPALASPVQTRAAAEMFRLSQVASPSAKTTLLNKLLSPCSLTTPLLCEACSFPHPVKAFSLQFLIYPPYDSITFRLEFGSGGKTPPPPGYTLPLEGILFPGFFRRLVKRDPSAVRFFS